ncbi:hypothetical protein ACLB2K_021107 [Fragaria x ananassa]
MSSPIVVEQVLLGIVWVVVIPGSLIDKIGKIMVALGEIKNMRIVVFRSLLPGLGGESVGYRRSRDMLMGIRSGWHGLVELVRSGLFRLGRCTHLVMTALISQ